MKWHNDKIYPDKIKKEIPWAKEMKFVKMSEHMDKFCFIISFIGLNRSNIRKINNGTTWLNMLGGD